MHFIRLQLRRVRIHFFLSQRSNPDPVISRRSDPDPPYNPCQKREIKTLEVKSIQKELTMLLTRGPTVVGGARRSCQPLVHAHRLRYLHGPEQRAQAQDTHLAPDKLILQYVKWVKIHFLRVLLIGIRPQINP